MKKKDCNEITDPRKLERREQPKIDTDLRIHCPVCVRHEFKMFVTKYDFKNQWGALLYLLKHVREDEIAKTGTRVVTVER